MGLLYFAFFKYCFHFFGTRAWALLLCSYMWQRCVLRKASIAVTAAVVKDEVVPVRNQHTTNVVRI